MLGSPRIRAPRSAGVAAALKSRLPKFCLRNFPGQFHRKWMVKRALPEQLVHRNYPTASEIVVTVMV